MFSLEKEIKNHFTDGMIDRVTFGYGVLFPDIEFNDVGTEGAQEQVFDRRDRRFPFSDYIHRLIKFTHTRQSAQPKKLSKTELDKLVKYLRGDFDLVPLISTMLEDARSKLAELTAEQMYVLDAVQDYNRLIIDGPAGSGKTLLAIEVARRAARLGQHVAFLCYNRQLASMVKAHLDTEPFVGSVDVRTLNSLFYELVDQSSLKEEFEQTKINIDEEALYQALYPEYATLAAMELVAPPFDVLVIDEAQDILTNSNLRALSETLKGGIENGRWHIFLDANDQACVYGRLDSGSLEELRKLAQREPLLTFNCRNTKPIGAQINIVAEPTHRTACRVSGPPVEYLTYNSEKRILGKIEQALNSIRAERINPGFVSILFPETPSIEDQKGLKRMGIERLGEEEVPILGTTALEHYTWSPISGFKGLENDVIILAGIRDIESDWWRSINYVGFSRARVRLYVIIHESCTAEREKRLAAELKRTLAPRD